MDTIYEEREAYSAELVPLGAISTTNVCWNDPKLGIVLNPVMTHDEWSSIGNKINTASIKCTVKTRFGLGDWYNHLASEKHGSKKQAVIDSLRSIQNYNMAKACGWIANKWPIKLRGLAGDWVPVWSFYKYTAPFSMEIKLEALELWMKGGMTMDDLKEFLDQEREPKTPREELKSFILKLSRILVKDDDADLESVAQYLQDRIGGTTSVAQPA